jgi:hypothetical protein
LFHHVETCGNLLLKLIVPTALSYTLKSKAKRKQIHAACIPNSQINSIIIISDNFQVAKKHDKASTIGASFALGVDG